MAKQPPAPKLRVTKVEVEDVIGIVQGTMPDSKNEWYVALALDKLNVEYMFQYTLFGGTSIRGGQIVDFVCFIPTATPVFIQGEYWHDRASETEDMLKQAAAEQYFKTKPILLMGEDTDEKDKAFQTVRRELGV